MGRHAVAATLPNHPYLALYLSNLGTRLGYRFQRNRSIQDLEEAINTGRRAVAATPLDHPKLAQHLSNLGHQLSNRFQWNRSIQDLEEAINIGRRAVAVTPLDNPNHAGYLNNLGIRLGFRFQWNRSIQDLAEAIDIERRTMAVTPPDHPYLAGYLNNLGARLYDRFQRNRSIQDLEEANSLCQKALDHKPSQPLQRIICGIKVAKYLISLERWEDAATDLEVTVDLLPMVAIRSNSREDLQYALQSFSGLASLTASVFLKARKSALEALEFLEYGRGIIASLTMDLRSDESQLQAEYPELWSRYARLRQDIALATLPDNNVHPESLATGQITPTARSDQRLRLFKKLETIETEIQSQKGFERFHLAPTEKQLLQLACHGPLAVFNTSNVSSEAFLIMTDSIEYISLPEFNISSDKTKDLKSYIDSLSRRGNQDRRDATIIEDSETEKSTNLSGNKVSQKE
jgi:hypothetical protein